MPTPYRSSDPQGLVTSVTTSAAEPAARFQPEMAVFSTDLQGGFLACNAAFSALIGYTPQELRGRNVATIFAPTEKMNGDRSLGHTILAAAGEQGDYHSRLYAQ